MTDKQKEYIEKQKVKIKVHSTAERIESIWSIFKHAINEGKSEIHKEKIKLKKNKPDPYTQSDTYYKRRYLINLIRKLKNYNTRKKLCENWRINRDLLQELSLGTIQYDWRYPPTNSYMDITTQKAKMLKNI